MKKKYITDVLVEKLSLPDLKENTSKYEIPEKQHILNYLRKASKYAYTSAPVRDAFTKTELSIINDMYSDGEYYWAETEIYHFDRYNLQLNPEFIEYVIQKDK